MKPRDVISPAPSSWFLYWPGPAPLFLPVLQSAGTAISARCPERRALSWRQRRLWKFEPQNVNTEHTGGSPSWRGMLKTFVSTECMSREKLEAAIRAETESGSPEDGYR
ncbi:hypothetical protein J6590_009990 [Homalodisca vitripennis]|nr:hypothetical protein J6590_009990 [Homalodisca vitripennis]